MISSSKVPFIFEGQVVDTNDPDQMGRVRVWIPALDGEEFEVESMPWAEYAPVFAGFTVDYPAGGGPVENLSHTAYGWWAIPKIGATVFVFCLAGDPTRRCYFASSLRLHRNRSLPVGRNFDINSKPGPWGDAGDANGNLHPIEPAYTNLRDQFQDKMTEPEAITRGLYERQAAQQKFDKDGTEGYSKTPIKGEKYLDSQTYCFVTPGRHALIFQDDPKFARLRMKTAEGHQLIFDDANERIYFSTAKGKTWIEMDLDGHIHIFGSESISVRSGKDINFFADRDINFEAERAIHIKANTDEIRVNAKKDIHMQAAGNFLMSSCLNFHINSEKALRITSIDNMDVKTGADFAATAARGMDLKAGEIFKQTGAKIHLNGPTARTARDAECAKPAQEPPIVPGHEPWKRPTSKNKRGPNWRA